MPVNINGSTGIDTPGLASDGMPTSGGDPVVESGSNSDGEWVRWADGTQECYTKLQIQPGEGTSAGGLYTSPLNTPLFPLSFLESPSGSVGYSDSNDLGFWLHGRGINTTQWGVKFFRLNSFTGTGGETVELKATGRWK